VIASHVRRTATTGRRSIGRGRKPPERDWPLVERGDAHLENQRPPQAICLGSWYANRRHPIRRQCLEERHGGMVHPRSPGVQRAIHLFRRISCTNTDRSASVLSTSRRYAT